MLSFLRARPDGPTTYHRSKWQAEELVRRSGLTHTILKAGVIHGRGDHMLDHLSHAFHTFPVFGLVGLRERPVRPVAVDDVVGLLSAAALGDARLADRTIAVLGPESMPLGEAVRRVARVTGRRPLFVRLPVTVHLGIAAVAEATMRIPLDQHGPGPHPRRRRHRATPVRAGATAGPRAGHPLLRRHHPPGSARARRVRPVGPPLRDMTRIRLETDIDAPIERVYDLARDLDLHARSMAHTNERAVGGRTSGRIELGETVTWRARHFGITWSLTSRITIADPPTRFVDQQERGPFRSFRHEHRFEPRPGGTRLVDEWIHVAPFGPLGRLVDRLVLARYMRRLLETRNRALKAEAEAAAGTPPGQVVGSGMNGPSAADTATNSGRP